jgi:DNA-binding transcriptional regulator LsrR (DeoR family)
MAKENKREEAEKLYVRQSMTCPQIAAELGVNDGTVYRWKAEAAAQGETTDWDAQRRAFNMSPRELVSIYSESLKAWIVEIKQNPETLSDPKIADAIVKHISALQKLDNRSQYMGVALDLIKIANQWLTENQSELKAQMEPYWESIYQELAKYSTGKGLFE